MPAAPLHETLQRLLGDRFRLESELFGGGMSRVFVAEEPALARRVVVKVLPPDLLDAKSLARFEREVAVTARLQHPHILPIVSAGSGDGLSWYIAPFIEGRSLRDRLAKGERLPRAEALRILAEVAEAVAFAHARGVVHRDIKPANVLLHEGHALLADFGVAGALAGEDDGGGITGVETHAGLSSYLPPDRPRAEGADLWALGALAHELCTGVPPEPPVSARAVEDRLAVVGGHRDATSRALAACIARALSADPVARFPAAAEFAAEVARVRALDATVDRPWGRRVAAVAFVALGASLAIPLVRDRVRDETPGERPVAVRVASGVPQAEAWRDSITVALREWRDVRVAAAGEAPHAQALTVTQVADARVAGMLAGSNGRPIRTLLVDAGGRGPSLDAARRIVGVALLGDSEPVFRAGSGPGSESLAAWRRYVVAQDRFVGGVTDSAAAALRAVLAVDRGHRGALVRLAILNRLSGDSARAAEATIQWREAGRRRGALTARDSLRAAGWGALLGDGGARDVQRACTAFGALVEQAPEAWDAWLGLGECHFGDERVVADPASPTGLRFVVGREATARAFERVVALLGGRAPRLAYDRLRVVLPLQANAYRYGARPDGPGRVGGPVLVRGDTLVHFPTREIATYVFSPLGSRAALEHTRARYRRAVQQWATAAPDDPGPWAALAAVLEAEGALVVPAEGQALDALGALDRAERLSSPGPDRLRFTADRARVLLKGGKLAEAMALIVRTLESRPSPTTDEALVLTPLAALAGDRARLLALLQRIGGGGTVVDSLNRPVTLPPSLLGARAEFNAAVLAGACDEAVRHGPARIALEARGTIPDPEVRARVVEQVVARPQGIGMLCTRAPMPPMRWFLSDPQWPLVEAALAGDRTRFAAAIREAFADPAITMAQLSGDVSHAIAWGHLALGDTARAYAELESLLGGIKAARAVLFTREEEAAALRRSLLLARALAPRLPGVDRGAWWLADAPTLEPVRR